MTISAESTSQRRPDSTPDLKHSTRLTEQDLIYKMSAQNSAGIQTLLDAEREAQKIVQEAREYRTKRIKDAKAEAQKEIEEYRGQKEQAFKKFEAEHTSGNKKAEDEASREAEKTQNQIMAVGKEKGDKVIEDLLRAVLEVKPEVPAKIAAKV